ncbi:hypothetical protein [Methylorubrum populi]|uniref:Uncharacterized protein n=1 Tax=Methylorubrum populi TaxID=223967 RepID=A0A833MYG1_9HYPH|nr:hypothetical protein [Methylorubrum populi]KAB7782413.1 hypothetical protein F8B43_5168 [Methylorubrum populi]
MGSRRPKLSQASSLAAFRKWLTANGATVMAPTSRFEVVRFRGAAGVSIIYRNENARPHKMTGEAQAAWNAFVEGRALDLSPPPPAYIGDAERRVVATSDADLIACAGRRPITVAFLMERDELPMREATARLFGLERRGLLTRSGGRGSGPLLWACPSSFLPDEPAHA